VPLVVAVVVFLVAVIAGLAADAASTASISLNVLGYPACASVLICPLVIASIVLSARAEKRGALTAFSARTLVVSAFCLPPAIWLLGLLLLDLWSRSQ
jgi:hypothetical protein